MNMKIILPAYDHNFKDGLVSGVMNGGTVWLHNICDGLKANGIDAEVIDLYSKNWEADVVIIQSEWTGLDEYRKFNGKKVVLLGHFIKGVYPDPHNMLEDLAVTVWSGEILDGFRHKFLPHAFNDQLADCGDMNRGEMVWCGNSYALRDEGWLTGLPVTQVKGVFTAQLSSIYKGKVCPNIQGDFQQGIVSNDPSTIADKPGFMLNERFWHTIGAGGVLIQQYNPQILEFFDEDEIIMAKSKEEFQAKCRYYLEHRDEGIKFYERARAKVFKHHTYKNRAKTLIDLIKNEI